MTFYWYFVEENITVRQFHHKSNSMWLFQLLQSSIMCT
eukprot:UN10338